MTKFLGTGVNVISLESNENNLISCHQRRQHGWRAQVSCESNTSASQCGYWKHVLKYIVKLSASSNEANTKCQRDQAQSLFILTHDGDNCSKICEI